MPTAAPSLRIAVLGTGSMGSRVALRLCAAGHQVHLWNRSAAKAEALQPHGAKVHATPCAAVAHSDFILCTLEHGQAVSQVLFGMGEASAVHGLHAHSLWIDLTSLQPREARDHASRLSERGMRYLDAPVSGGTVGAERGALAIMVGGKAEDVAAAQPVFAALGHATHVGPHGAGQLAKLANQLIVGVTIGAVAEALLLCAKGGADMAKVREAMRGGFADSPILQLHGQRMTARDFAPGARMAVQLQDMHNALATAEEIGFDAPVTRLLAQLYADAVEHGLGALDHSGVFVELASRNALQ